MAAVVWLSNQSCLLFFILVLWLVQLYLLYLKSCLEELSKQYLRVTFTCNVYMEITVFNALVKISTLNFFKGQTWISLCMLCLILSIFLMQYINWWTEIPTSITPFWEIVSEELVRIWSSREEVKQFISVGSFMISVNENVWQKSLYLFAETDMEFLCWYDWISLRMNFPFRSKLILMSPKDKCH